MNIVALIGNLVRDPEMRYTPTGVAVTQFTIALNRPKKEGQEQQADFVKIITWNKLAENCGNYLAKGRKVGVEGRLQSGSYQDKNGRIVYTLDVVASSVEFLTPANENTPSGFHETNTPTPWD